MTRFKKGDVVRRLVDDFGCAEVGKIYVVRGISAWGGIHLNGDDKPERTYAPEYFKLVGDINE